MADLLVRIEMEPALTARFLRSAVPGDRQGLQPAIGELDQILLKRVQAKRVFDLENGKLAVRAVSFDQELLALAKEARTHAVVVEGCTGEIAQHRRLGCVIHRVLVLRTVPQLALRSVAPCTRLGADKFGGR